MTTKQNDTTPTTEEPLAAVAGGLRGQEGEPDRGLSSSPLGVHGYPCDVKPAELSSSHSVDKTVFNFLFTINRLFGLSRIGDAKNRSVDERGSFLWKTNWVERARRR